MWADYEDVRWRSTRWMDSAVDFCNASRGYNIDYSGIPIEYEVGHVRSFIFLYPDEPVQRRPSVTYRRYRPWVCSTITACKAHEDSFRGLTQFSLSGNSKRFCGEGFWGWPRRRGRRIPAVGCNGRANAGHRQRTRRPEGSRGNGPWLRCSSVTDPCGYAPSSRLHPAEAGTRRRIAIGPFPQKQDPSEFPGRL